jgi:hypothetical protein
VDKEYSAGIHRFTTVGDGSNTASVPNLIGQPRVDVMTIRNSNVGIGTNNPLVSLDIRSKDAIQLPKGSNSDRPLDVTDGLIRYNQEQQTFEGYSKNIWGAIGGGGGGESYWSSNLDTNTLFYSSNNVGIATNQAFYTLDVNGTIRTSNLILSGTTFIQEDSPAIRNRLQLRPLVIRQQISTLNPNTSNFSGYYDGFYKATAENTHVFVNSIKKIYRSSNERDYAVTYARDTLNNRTLFDVTLEETPSYGDLIDITIWPEYDDPMGILQPGYVLQNIAYNINVGNGTEGSMGQVQVNPYRTIYYTSNTQSIFDLTVPGIFGGGPVQTQVFIGQKLLSYYNSNVKDYDVSYMFGSNINGKYTTYTITLNQPATFGNVVDITVSPQLVQGSDPMFGYVYQSFSQFERYGSNIFYTLGNIGIGTTVARVSLDTNRTDAYRLPTGSNSERPEGVDGYIRYNQEQQTFEGYSKNTWGAIGGGGGGITDADNITTSNLTVLGNLNIGAASGILKNRLQVNPLRKITYIETSTCNSFYLDTEGIFGGHASNVDVYIGLQRLLYYTSNITYYDVNYTNSSDRTYYTITLTQPAIFGDLVDITVWPQMIQASSNLPGYVYQQLIMTYFEKNNGLTASSNDLYYTLGNLGIGTSNTELAKLTVAGDILPSSCNVYDLGSSNYRWRDLYLSGNTIDLGGTRISRNNATGGMKITSKVNDDPLDFTAQHINALGTLFASNITIAGNNFVVGDNGSVGIGTNIPQSKMHIYPTNSYNLLQIDYNAQADVNVYPPSAISGNSVTITGQPYGNGSYTISSSTYYSPHNDYYVFDKNITSTLSKWLSQLNLYNSLGNYTGSVQTTHTTGTINGEWIQIFLPTTIQIISYSIANYSTESIYNRFPYKWNLLGSTNGTTWILLDSINNYTTWSGNLYYTFNVSPTQGYSYYRWVFEKTQENPSNGCVSITEIRLNSGNTTITPFVVATQYGNVGIGTALPTQKLDVRGNIYASGNIVCSNISVIGDFVRLNTITSNTEQMVVENAGTGPALKVTQSGANSVAEFYDSESGVALFVGNNGNIGIGTNAPLAKLDLVGNVNVSGDVYKRFIGCYVNTSQTLTSGVETTLLFSNIVTTSGHYVAATGLFTCPVNGYYSVTSSVLNQLNSGNNRLRIYRSGTKMSIDGWTLTTEYCTCTINVIVSCTAGQTLYSTSLYSQSGYASMSIQLL